jgi:GrpB-like predicted nucleotidyltransferase (UPF0157 family)
VFRRSIVSGREEISPDPSPEALDQLRLRYRRAAAAADFRTMIRGRPCHVIVLLPSPESVAAREAERDRKGYGDGTVEQLYDGFVNSTPRVGTWLDTTHLTPDETVDTILAQTSSVRSPLVVADYDNAWPTLFEEISRPIRHVVGELGAVVEHVGSTAVPGLAAKPVVDIDVVVTSGSDVPLAIERLRALGYVYQGNKGITGREAFMWPPGAPPHHLYVVVSRTRPHADHVQIRDYLRRHADVAAEYAALKKDLAARYRGDRLGYTEAKTNFVADVLRAARGWTSAAD